MALDTLVLMFEDAARSQTRLVVLKVLRHTYTSHAAHYPLLAAIASPIGENSGHARTQTQTQTDRPTDRQTDRQTDRHPPTSTRPRTHARTHARTHTHTHTLLMSILCSRRRQGPGSSDPLCRPECTWHSRSHAADRAAVELARHVRYLIYCYTVPNLPLTRACTL